MPEDEEQLIPRRDMKTIATMFLSGTEVEIGTYSHHQGDSLWFKIDGQLEESHFSIVEGDLLVAAIRAAQADLKEG